MRKNLAMTVGVGLLSVGLLGLSPLAHATTPEAKPISHELGKKKERKLGLSHMSIKTMWSLKIFR